jgi:hypothetical protein
MFDAFGTIHLSKPAGRRRTRLRPPHYRERSFQRPGYDVLPWRVRTKQSDNPRRNHEHSSGISAYCGGLADNCFGLFDRILGLGNSGGGRRLHIHIRQVLHVVGEE